MIVHLNWKRKKDCCNLLIRMFHILRQVSLSLNILIVLVAEIDRSTVVVLTIFVCMHIRSVFLLALLRHVACSLLLQQWRSRTFGHSEGGGGQICRPFLLGFGNWRACLKYKSIL